MYMSWTPFKKYYEDARVSLWMEGTGVDLGSSILRNALCWTIW